MNNYWSIFLKKKVEKFSNKKKPNRSIWSMWLRVYSLCHQLYATPLGLRNVEEKEERLILCLELGKLGEKEEKKKRKKERELA